MENNKVADGTSTEGDTDEESVEEEDSGRNDGQAVVWPNNGATNGMPMVGGTRGGKKP